MAATRRSFPPARTWLFALVLAGLAGCGAIQPGVPGREPPSAGRDNPVNGETNSNGR